MGSSDEDFVILMADDDEDDCLLAKRVFEDVGIAGELRFVEDGEKLMVYLHRQGEYTDPEQSPCPDIVLLDLNMPRKDGREALREIKSDPRFRSIPVVILTTSNEDGDILLAYNAGASSFIVKPLTFAGWSEMATTLRRYWLETVTRPSKTSWC